MITEAATGESSLKEDENAAYRLRVRLGLEQGPVTQQEKEQGLGQVPSHRRSHRVGQRNPNRDPVRNSET